MKRGIIMSREIKFRAWNKQRKEMFEVANIDFKEKKVTLTNGIIRLPSVNFNDTELMQYTGLKDRNGKEIYEGDIVLIKLDETSTWYKTVVGFKKGAFIANLIDKEDYVYIFHHGFTDDDFEIIGNVYENKNLLEENN